MPAPEGEDWRPGSFAKNFSWGNENGLRQLFDAIRTGFDAKLKEVPREVVRERVVETGRSVYIPINFFLFNQRRHTTDVIVVDELVFQALMLQHNKRFDKLALFAFNFSYAGRFKRATKEQRRPATWAYHYIRDRVAADYGWDTKRVSANDIENFVVSDPRYQAEGARKLATNLNHLYRIGRLSDFSNEKVERWWVDALFLALDRLIEDQRLDRKEPQDKELADLLARSGFQDIAGMRSLEKDLATRHLIRLYIECGGRDRFSEEAVRARTALRLGEIEIWAALNNEASRGAVHPTNPRILKSIPQACAMLARYAGFEIISALEMEDFDPDKFVRRMTQEALQRLKEEGVSPTMSAEEVLRLTRGR